MKKLILFALLAVFLTSCGRHSDGTSVWVELWVIPTGLILGALWSLYRAYKSHKSGSTKIIQGKVTNIEAGKIPIYKLPQFYYFVALTLAAIGVIIWVNLEK